MFKKILVAGTLALSLGAGCLPAKNAETPDRATARATILTVAKAVSIADQACATYATANHDAATAKKCADAYDLARPSLVGAEAAVDGWSDATAGNLACLSADAISALEQFAGIFLGAQLALPTTVVDALHLADTLHQLCVN